MASKSNLNPIWKRIASAKNLEQVTTFQATFGYYKDQLNETHITFVADSSLLATTLNLVWDMTTLVAIGNSIQSFRFVDTDLEAAQIRQSEMECQRLTC